jgi:hypothetical protein
VKLLRCLLALSLAVGWAGAARALPITLTLVPSAVSLAPDDTLTVTIAIDGLTDDEGEIALESFDLDLAFDNTRLQFESLAFDINLGDPNDGFETFLSGPGNPNVNGVVEMGEFSFLTEAQLLALQDAPFALVTIEFTALDNPGGALLELINLTGTSLGGPGGQALGDDLAAPSSLLVDVLPEPATATLLIAALALLGLRRRSFAS